MLRHREQKGPLSLSHYPVTLLCFHWQSRSPHRSVLRGLRKAPNTWGVTPVEGVMMEKATRRGKHESMGRRRRGMEQMWGDEGEKNKLYLLFCKKFVQV